MSAENEPDAKLLEPGDGRPGPRRERLEHVRIREAQGSHQVRLRFARSRGFLDQIGIKVAAAVFREVRLEIVVTSESLFMRR